MQIPHKSTDLIFLNSAFITVELARHQELINWGLTAAGSATLIALNLLRLWKELRNPQPKSEQREKKWMGAKKKKG